jgi:hemoglobin/transferrin/lactoferrin receptor protein
VQDRIEITPSLELLLGGRFTYARAEAGAVAIDIDGDGTDEPVSLDEDWVNFAGNARFSWFIDEEDHWNIFGGVSQGFRAPNLSDLTRDADFGGGVETPAPGLDPENYVMFEIGAKAQYPDLTFQGSFFHYLMFDRIIRVDANAPGVEFGKINSDDGFIQGIELGAAWRFLPELELFGNFAYFDSEVQSIHPNTNEIVDDYTSRLPPTMGQIGLRYEPNNLPVWAEGEVELAADADRLSFRDQADDERIPDGGTPGYAVASIRGGWEVNEHATLTVGLENIFDADYRVHGSGQNRPGRNLIVTLEGRF